MITLVSSSSYSSVQSRQTVSTLLWGQCSSIARQTLFSSWSAVGRASGSESSMSSSSSHIAWFGGGGSGGARLALIGMVNCRSGFWHSASPNGVSQRPRITYAPRASINRKLLCVSRKCYAKSIFKHFVKQVLHSFLCAEFPLISQTLHLNLPRSLEFNTKKRQQKQTDAFLQSTYFA